MLTIVICRYDGFIQGQVEQPLVVIVGCRGSAKFIPGYEHFNPGPNISLPHLLLLLCA